MPDSFFTIDSSNVGPWGWPKHLFWERCHNLEYPHVVQRGGASPVGSKEVIEKLQCTVLMASHVPTENDEKTSEFFLLEKNSHVMYFESHYDGDWALFVAGPSFEGCNELSLLVDDILPQFQFEPDRTLPVAYYYLTTQGPTSQIRRIDIHQWDDIKDNYPKSHQGQLGDLIHMQPPDTGGKLLLLHGPAGTGKTSFIRTLIHGWYGWADTSYICDPEEFFGKAAYMMQVLLQQKANNRWHLLIVEDCDELIAKDAKARSGQGLTRLLNTTDGLIGQGLRVLLLITTNENIKELHPAVQRPGRCLANQHFPAFAAAEARDWVDRQGGDRLRVDNDMTLAEMFERIRPRQIAPHRQVIKVGQYL